MRKDSLILIVAIIAVVALTIAVPVFASGCGDDTAAYGSCMAKQVQDPDVGGDCPGGCRGDGECDGTGCVGNGDGNGTCVGTCLDAVDQPFGDEPICF